jgi:SagB-type dehydrogenase family enzyme
VTAAGEAGAVGAVVDDAVVDDAVVDDAGHLARQMIFTPADLLPTGPTDRPVPLPVPDPALARVNLPTLYDEEGLAWPSVSRAVDASVLSLLLAHGYGLSYLDLVPGASRVNHRVVASARCLFPVDVEVLVPDGVARIPAGRYVYDPLHHQLARVSAPERPGPGEPPADGRAGRAAGEAGAVIPAGGIRLLVVAEPPRTAYRYGRYAWRLVLQEAGMVAESLRLVADALGLGVSVHALPLPHHALGGVDRRPVVAVDVEPCPGRSVSPAPDEILQGRALRRSGHAVFNDVAAPVPAGVLPELATAAAAGPVLGCHLVIRSASDLPAGHHLVDGDRLVLRRAGDLTRELERTGTGQGTLAVDYRSVNAVVFLTAPFGRDPVPELVRGSLECGAAAQRASVSAARSGLVARVHNGYRAAAARELLGLPEDEAPFFQILLGRSRPDSVYGTCIPFVPDRE